MEKIGRNDPCPCGSGKKFKQCCLNSKIPDAAAQVSTTAQARQFVETLTQIEKNHLAALFSAGRFAEMESAACRLLEMHPRSGFVWKAIGTALLEQRKDAVEALQRAAELLPGDAETFNNLGKALQNCGRVNEAVTIYRHALTLRPDFAEAECGLSLALLSLGQVDEAEASCRQALAHKPAYAMAYNNLGNALRDRGQLSEAMTSYRRALEIAPNLAIAHNNLGNVLRDCRLLDEALTSYRRAMEIDPVFIGPYDNLLMSLEYTSQITQEDQFAAHQRFGEQFEAPLKPQWSKHTNHRDPRKRLKIGYVSGDFRMHPVSYFIESVFDHHDKSQVEVFAYSNSAKQDSVTERLIAKADHWQPCLGMSDDQLAQRIRADGIDILVDLAGHTAHNRLLAFARKPAPIQITYLGYPGTSGLTAMDYRLTDHYAEPGSDQYYTEKLLRLPDSMWCYRPAENMPEVTPSPALANGYLTFGSFNNANKVGSECIALWAALLRRLPTSRLLMATVPQGEMRQRLVAQFEGHGIAAERIAFCGQLSSHDFHRALQQADLTLDPFPVNGATTTCESLWLGVPVLTLIGERFLSRAGFSVLSAAHLPEFAAATPEQLIEITVSLANDLPHLASIRAGMRERLKTTPLFDQQRFTRNLESIYRDVWRRYTVS